MPLFHTNALTAVIDVYNAIPLTAHLGQLDTYCHNSKIMSQKIGHLLLIEAMMHFIRYIVKRLAFLCQHIMGSVHIFSRLKYVLGLCFFLARRAVVVL